MVCCLVGGNICCEVLPELVLLGVDFVSLGSRDPAFQFFDPFLACTHCLMHFARPLYTSVRILYDVERFGCFCRELHFFQYGVSFFVVVCCVASCAPYFCRVVHDLLSYFALEIEGGGFVDAHFGELGDPVCVNPPT